VDERADVYALGMTLYEMLAGQLPWEEQLDVVAVLKLKLEGAIPPPTRFYPDIPSGVVSVLHETLRTEPAQRLATVTAFSGALHALADHRGASPKHPPFRIAGRLPGAPNTSTAPDPRAEAWRRRQAAAALRPPAGAGRAAFERWSEAMIKELPDYQYRRIRELQTEMAAFQAFVRTVRRRQKIARPIMWLLFPFMFGALLLHEGGVSADSVLITLVVSIFLCGAIEGWWRLTNRWMGVAFRRFVRRRKSALLRLGTRSALLAAPFGVTLEPGYERALASVLTLAGADPREADAAVTFYRETAELANTPG